MYFLFVSKPQHDGQCEVQVHLLYVFSLRQQATTDCLYSINIQCVTGYKEGKIMAS